MGGEEGVPTIRNPEKKNIEARWRVGPVGESWGQLVKKVGLVDERQNIKNPLLTVT